ncbi:MAG TPA: biotin/lipoyl-binding protein, partial [Planctomycetaceae bacterium]|nr:biotin/lipoyl-binding protein [Planctomycetaceae bacterium]
MAAPPVDRPAESLEHRSAKPAPPAERPPIPKPDPALSRPPRRWGWVFWVVALGLGAAGWHYREQLEPYVAPVVAKLSPPKPTKPPQRAAMVGTAPVRQRDVNFYLNGLGTVTAFQAVTVRSRVEGELVKVAMQEGQFVKEGDVLAEIDPRLFEAQRDQAQAQLARDQA